MPIVRVKFGPELDLAPPGWHWVTCQKAITDVSKNNNAMFVLTMAADGYRPFRVWLLLPGEDQAVFSHSHRSADINAALRAFEVPTAAGGVLPWPGVPSAEQAFDLDSFVEREAKLWVAVKPAEKGFPASNFVEWRGRP